MWAPEHQQYTRLVHQNTPISCCMTTIQIIIMQLIIFFSHLSLNCMIFLFFFNRIKFLVQRHDKILCNFVFNKSLSLLFIWLSLCLHLLDIYTHIILTLIVGARICWTTKHKIKIIKERIGLKFLRWAICNYCLAHTTFL